MTTFLRAAALPLAVLAVVLSGHLTREAGVASAQGAAQSVGDDHDIRPLLAEACLTCHGPNENTRQADLRFDTNEFIGAVVVPGDAEASPLFQRLTTGDTIARMPPVSSGRSLTDDQIEIVRRWIDAGAVWEGHLAATDPGATATTARVVDFDREVRPILSANCFSCHGPDEQGRQRGLRLDVQTGSE